MASMKDLDRMLKRGGKTTRKMPLKAGSWLANATRPVISKKHYPEWVPKVEGSRVHLMLLST